MGTTLCGPSRVWRERRNRSFHRSQRSCREMPRADEVCCLRRPASSERANRVRFRVPPPLLSSFVVLISRFNRALHTFRFFFSPRLIVGASCTCKAGVRGCCKHGAALATFVNSEKHTACTDRPCAWGEPSSRPVLDKKKRIDELFPRNKSNSNPRRAEGKIHIYISLTNRTHAFTVYFDTSTLSRLQESAGQSCGEAGFTITATARPLC